MCIIIALCILVKSLDVVFDSEIHTRGSINDYAKNLRENANMLLLSRQEV